MGHLQFQNHDRDCDRQHTITEGLKPVLVHDHLSRKRGFRSAPASEARTIVIILQNFSGFKSNARKAPRTGEPPPKPAYAGYMTPNVAGSHILEPVATCARKVADFNRRVID